MQWRYRTVAATTRIGRAARERDDADAASTLIVALILAGGQARRMGGIDKPLLPLGDGTILDHLLATLHPLPIAISANGNPRRFAAVGRPVLADGAFAGQGPLAGLLAGLDWAAGQGATTLLSVPGDTPFVPRGIADRLAPAPACAATAGRVHPLVALWPVSCRAALRGLFGTASTRAVMAFARQVGLRTVDFPAQPFDPFLNVNTPEDLAIAQRRYAARPITEASP